MLGYPVYPVLRMVRATWYIPLNTAEREGIHVQPDEVLENEVEVGAEVLEHRGGLHHSRGVYSRALGVCLETVMAPELDLRTKCQGEEFNKCVWTHNRGGSVPWLLLGVGCRPCPWRYSAGHQRPGQTQSLSTFPGVPQEVHVGWSC